MGKLMTDDELIMGCLKNDPFSQQQLYDKYYRQTLKLCKRYTNDHDTALEYLQLAFIKLFKNLGGFNHDGSFEVWFRKITSNICVDNINLKKRIRHGYGNIDTTVSIDMLEYVENEKISSELNMKHLISVISSLPVGYKTVFNLYVLEGYTHKEIGEMLKISESTSKTQYLRAKKTLKEKLTV